LSFNFVYKLKAAAVEPSTWVVHEKAKVKDVFINLILGEASFQWLRKKKFMEAKLRSLKVIYTLLKKNIQGFILQLGSTEKKIMLIIIRWIP
jgi:hypothetical protein